jgi:hypothetical protein
MRSQGADAVNADWLALDDLERGALLLVREFNGEVVREFDDDPPEWG